MKKVRMNVKCFAGIVLFFFSTTLFGQDGYSLSPNVPIDANCNGYLKYLPSGYTGGTARYPLIVYINGNGSTGDGSAASLESIGGMFTGGGVPHEQQRPRSAAYPHDPSWVEGYTVNGTLYKFITVTPQFITPYGNRFPTPQEVNDVITHIVNNYRVDTTRIYLLGSSTGGGPVWEYVGNNSAYANRIAAIMPFGGVSWPDEKRANIIKNAKVAVWAFHNELDNSVPSSFSKDYIDLIKKAPAPIPPAEARLTLFPGITDHLCWFNPLMRLYTEGGMNVYQWLLQFSRTATKAYAGNDVELTLPASGITLHASGTGPNNTAASYSWQKISGPAAGSLSNANTANPIVLGLTAGTYVYRVTITDNIGGTQSDDVAVTVHDIQHKEAELFNASSGVATGPTDDGGPATAVINIDPGQWMDYNITVPTAGNYFMRFRTSAFYYGAQFQVKNSSGTVLATINSYNSGSTNNYITSYRTVPLTAGAQTLRIQSTSTIQPGQSASQWYFNWLEVENNAVADAPLPVNFVLFNANCVNGGVNLLWKTAGEVNAKNYSVERSVNGRDWTSLDILPATGRQGSEQSYQFSDLAPAGNGFYRIVLNEADGRKTYSSVIRSNCGRPLNFSVYPNPVIDRAILDISLEHSTKLSVSVVDSRGAVVRQQENILPSGSNQLSINMNGLPSGSYSLMARWDGEVQTVKLIKK